MADTLTTQQIHALEEFNAELLELSQKAPSPLYARPVVTDVDFFASEEARLQEKSQQVQHLGMLLGDAFISRGDKPSGVEPGNRVYIRDERYFSALEQITGNFNPDLPNESQAEEAISKGVGLESFIELVRQVIYDKITPVPMQNHAQYIALIQKTNKYEILEELKKLKKHQPTAMPWLGNFLQAFQNENVLSAICFMRVYQDRLEQATALPRNVGQIHAIMRDLESKFASNPVLFEMYIKEIEKTGNSYNVASWLIKLDYDNPEGSPGVCRTDMTKAIKNSNMPGFMLNIKSTAYNFGRGRGKFLSPKDSADAFVSPYMETIANRHAQYSGMQTQEIHIGYGSYVQATILKPVIFVRWQPGMHTLEDLAEQPVLPNVDRIIFAGGKALFTNVLAYKDKERGGALVSATKLFRNLGRNFANMLLQADRDGIGKTGQNKGAVVKDGKLEFFGFDFGKAYDPATSVLQDLTKLDDAFNFEQPSTKEQEALVNFHIFYDTSYSERLFGVQLLHFQQLRFLLQATDRADQNYPLIKEKVELVENALLSHASEDDSLKAIQGMLAALEANPWRAFDEQLATCKAKKDTCTDPTDKQHLQIAMDEIEAKRQMAEHNLDNMLKIFGKRLNLTKVEADALSALESIAALPKTTMFSASAKQTVQLNYPYVAKADRLPIQFELDPSNNKPLFQDGVYIVNFRGAKKSPQEFIGNLNKYLQRAESTGVTCRLNGDQILIPLAALQYLSAPGINAFIAEFGSKPVAGLTYLPSSSDARLESATALADDTESDDSKPSSPSWPSLSRASCYFGEVERLLSRDGDDSDVGPIVISRPTSVPPPAYLLHNIPPPSGEHDPHNSPGIRPH